MLQVEDMVKAKFGPRIANEPRKHDVDEAVAKGAALYGAVKSGGLEIEGETGKPGPIVIHNVASRSYGIRVLKAGQPIVFNMIHKQDRVPVEKSKDFPVSEDDAAKLPLRVFENENLDDVASLEESSDVGETEMELTQGLKKGSPIRITFKLNDNGVLEFEALDVTNNKNVKATFAPNGALTPEQIEAARNTVGNLTVD